MTSSPTSQVSYQTVGTSKNRPRLWIEGLKLETAGFVKGARYTISFEKDRMILNLDPDGSRAVCGKARNAREIPLLDIALKDLARHFDTGSRVRVVFMPGRIEVSLHHEDTARADRETRFRANLEAGQLVEASMFTGGGISTHAIHTALADYGQDARLAWVVDADLSYLDAGIANNYAIDDDTVALVGRAEEIESRFFTEVDIFSFSMPCSPFSKAGRAKHQQIPEDHEGATVLFGTMAAIRAANPAVLISENVVEAKSAPAYILLQAELKRLGYRIFERVMDAADTGSIENRPRYWFIALSEGLAEGFSFDVVHAAALSRGTLIQEILQDDVPENAWSENSYLKNKAERDARAGKNFRRQVLSGKETRCGVIGRHYNKRRSTEPFLAREDGKERLFTPAEHAKMKSAPPALVDGLPATTAHQILGQSVDWRQAYIAMAQVMAHCTGRVIETLARTGKAFGTSQKQTELSEQLLLF